MCWQRRSRPAERRSEISTVAMAKRVTFSSSSRRMDGPTNPVVDAIRRYQRSCRASALPTTANNARPDQLRPQRCISACFTFGETNSVTSPPRDATSRTSVDDMNEYVSAGSGIRFQHRRSGAGSYSPTETRTRNRIRRASREQ